MEIRLPKVIGLCGYAGAGKDTVAEILDRRFGYRRLSIADPLKEHLRLEYGLSHAQLHGAEKDVYCARLGCTPRELFVRVGAEWRSENPPRLQVKWLYALDRMLIAGTLVAVSDLRQTQELNALVPRAGQGWLIRSTSNTSPSAQLDNEVAGLPVTRFARVVENNGNFNFLEQLVVQELTKEKKEMSDKKATTPNEQRSDVKNPNNPAHAADASNRVSQSTPVPGGKGKGEK